MRGPDISLYQQIFWRRREAFTIGAASQTRSITDRMRPPKHSLQYLEQYSTGNSGRKTRHFANDGDNVRFSYVTKIPLLINKFKDVLGGRGHYVF